MIPVPIIKPDFTTAGTSGLVAATSSSNAQITLPKSVGSLNLNKVGGVPVRADSWLIIVEGSDVFILIDPTGPATTSNVCLPVGPYGPMILPAGGVVNLITAGGSGVVSIVHADWV